MTELRRISAQYASSGMVLSRPIYDSHGNILFDSGTKLDSDALNKLIIYEVGEIIIEDWRVTDVAVQPLFPPELESETMQALRQFLTESRDCKGLDKALIDQAIKPIYTMTRLLYPDVIGEPNVSGCISLANYDYIQPAKVACLSLLMGRQAGLGMSKLANLGIAALLMNIGYIRLPPGLIEKLGKITEDEFGEIRKHAKIGCDLLGQTNRFSSEVCEAILQHHERWDGSGYPSGLTGTDISIFARIIAIADTHYALVSKRPWRKTLLPHEAVEYVMAYSGELFDTELVQIFARQVPLYPTGVTVKLNTGEMGIILDANIGHIGRPAVRICYDENARSLSQTYDIDLSEAKHQNILVVQVLEY